MDGRVRGDAPAITLALALTACFTAAPRPATPVTPPKPPEPAVTEWATPAGAWLTAQRIIDVVADDRSAFAYALVGHASYYTANAIARIDLTTGAVLETPHGSIPHQVYRIVRDPDGRIIAFGTSTAELAYAVDPTTLAVTELPIPARTASSPSPGPLRVVQSADRSKVILCLVGRPVTMRWTTTLDVIATLPPNPPCERIEFPNVPALVDDPRLVKVAPYQLGFVDPATGRTRTREGYGFGAITELAFDGDAVLSMSDSQRRWTGPTNPQDLGGHPSTNPVRLEPGPCANTTQIHAPSTDELAVVGNAGIYRLDKARHQVSVLEEYSRDRHAVYTTDDEIALVEDVERGGRLILWSPRGAIAWHSPLGAPITALAVDRATQRLAIGHADGTIEVRLLTRIRSDGEPFPVEVPMFEKTFCPK